MTIDERRTLLRSALKGSDPEDISGFAAMVVDLSMTAHWPWNQRIQT